MEGGALVNVPLLEPLRAYIRTVMIMYSGIRKARRREMESEEYMNRKSRKQRGEAEVSILIITTTIINIISQGMVVIKHPHLTGHFRFYQQRVQSVIVVVLPLSVDDNIFTHPFHSQRNIGGSQSIT